MPVLGEAMLDADGVLHGWCWSPQHPTERRIIDIMIDDEIATTLIASRFREDLRFRKFGDGHHGFSVTLTKHVATISPRSILSARDRATDFFFWQKTFGEISVPQELRSRLGTLKTRAGIFASSPAFTRAPLGGKTARASNAFGHLAETLQTRAGKCAPVAVLRPFVLPRPRAPAVSIILDATGDATSVFHALRVANPALHQVDAEVILMDDGTDPQTAKLQAQSKNLKYVLAPGLHAAARRNAGAAIARGAKIIFFSHLAGGLIELHRNAMQRIIVSGNLADAARRVAPGLTANIVEISSPAPPGFILATPRACIETYGAFDTTVSDGSGLDILDWVLRAARNGAEIAAWPCPDPSVINPVSPNLAAERRFAERWIVGASLPPLA